MYMFNVFMLYIFLSKIMTKNKFMFFVGVQVILYATQEYTRYYLKEDMQWSTTKMLEYANLGYQICLIVAILYSLYSKGDRLIPKEHIVYMIISLLINVFEQKY